MSDLTSEAFIAAFKRFISRRGRPAHMYLDNETTFLGAHRQIQELYDIYNDQQVQFEIKDFLREWKFHGASSRLMHSILEVLGGSRKICQMPHDSDRGQDSFDL